jgi:hypothetical protein
VMRASVRHPKSRYNCPLENDLAMGAREITSRHGVDKRSLLRLAARRDAVARNPTSRMAPRNHVVILQRLLSRVQSLYPQSMPLPLAQLVARSSRSEPEISVYMAYENGEKHAGDCGQSWIHVNSSNASKSCAWMRGATIDHDPGTHLSSSRSHMSLGSCSTI